MQEHIGTQSNKTTSLRIIPSTYQRLPRVRNGKLMVSLRKEPARAAKLGNKLAETRAGAQHRAAHAKHIAGTARTSFKRAGSAAAERYRNRDRSSSGRPGSSYGVGDFLGDAADFFGSFFG